MAEQIKVEVFGIRNQACKGGCNCNGSCGPNKTMGELYEEFIKFLSKSNIRKRIDINFVDILMDDMDGNTSVIDALDQGYDLPLTAINGEIKFYGGIANKMIYSAIRKSA
jgi:hypothetical protein